MARTGSRQLATPLAVWVVPYLASIMLPALWLITENWPHAFNRRLYFYMILWTAIPSALILFTLLRRSGRGPRWSLGVATVATLTLFQWPTFTRAGRLAARALEIPAIDSVLPVVLAGGLLWIAWRRAGELPFAATIGIGIVAITAAMAAASIPLLTPGSTPALGSAPPGSPDVIVIVLDGHAGPAWYRNNQLDGGDMLGDLIQRGFVGVADATANYSFTLGAYASILGLDYVFDAGPIGEDDLETMRAALVGEIGMIPRFRRAGYEIVYVENTWGGSQCGPAIDNCIGDGSLRRSLWAISQMTIFAPVVSTVATSPFNAQSLDQLLELEEILEKPPGPAPRLTIAHFIAPHPPLALRDDCSRRPVGSEMRFLAAEPGNRTRLEAYAEQSRCVNDVVVTAIDRVLAADPGTMAMIVADHGPGPGITINSRLATLSKETIVGRMQILSAYYLAGCDAAVPSGVTPVNGARIVTNCALGAGLDLLPDRNLWIRSDALGSVVDVSEMLAP